MITRLFRNGFIKKISIYFIGTLSSNLINALLLPLYAYFVAPGDLGEYDYILSVANMVVPVVYLCIWESVLRFGIKDSDDKELLMSNTVILYTLFSAVCVVIFFIIDLLNLTQTSLIMVLLFTVSQGGVQVWQYSSRAYGESKVYVIAGICGSVTVVVVDIIFISIIGLNWIGLSLSHILSQFMVLLILEFKLRLFFRVRLSNVRIAWIKRIFAFSVPLVINNVALWFYSGGIRLFIKNSLGATETGMYSFASKFSVIITLCGTVVSMAFTEEVYGFKSMEEYRLKTSHMIFIISKAYFTIVFLALPVIYLIYTVAFKNTEYFLSSDYVLALLLSVLFTALSNSYGSAFMVTNPKYISITTIVGATVAILLSLLLFEYIGIYAILAASIIGPFLMMLLRALYVKKVTGVCVNWKTNIVILTATCFSAYFLQTYRNLTVEIIVLLVVLLVCCYVYRSEIIKLRRESK